MSSLRVRLSADIGELHKKLSTWVALVFAAVLGFGPTLIDTWNFIPEDLKAALPQGTSRVVSAVGFILVLAARSIHVGKVDDSAK
jgi:hypothetical protein